MIAIKKLLFCLCVLSLIQNQILDEIKAQHHHRLNPARSAPFYRLPAAQGSKLDLGQPFVFIKGSPMMPYPIWDGMIDHRYGVHHPPTGGPFSTHWNKSPTPKYVANLTPPTAPPLPFPKISTKAAAFDAQQRAEAEFRNGNYEEAVRLARQVIILDAENGFARLFAAQCLFAIEDYSAAVQQIKIAIGLLPTEEWDFIVRQFRLFYGKNDFVDQMDRLNQYLADFPTHREGHLLRGYQFASLGYTQPAIDDLYYAIAVRADKQLANDLLGWISGTKLNRNDAQIAIPQPRSSFYQDSPLARPSNSMIQPPLVDQEIEELPTPNLKGNDP